MADDLIRTEMGMRPASSVRRVFIILICIAVISSVGVPVSTSSETDGYSAKKGTIEIGMMAGFWQATTAVGDASSANRSAVFVLPRVGIVVTDPLGTDWWRGNLELILEPVYARFTQPFAADLAGASLIAKYNFLSFGRWMPFWDVGAGMVWTNLAPRIPEESIQMEFLLQTGPGVHYFMTNTVTLTMGVRFSHISNADIGSRNTGINAVLPYLGVSFFLPR
jgi:hypothetical protein